MLLSRLQNSLYIKIEAAFAEAGYDLDLILEGSSIDLLLRFVARGIGMTIVPEQSVHLAEQLEGEIDFLPFLVGPAKTASLAVETAILWRKEQYRSPAAEQLEAVIYEVVQDLIISPHPDSVNNPVQP